MKAATWASNSVVMLVEYLDDKRVDSRVERLALKMAATLVVKKEHYSADVRADWMVE